MGTTQQLADFIAGTQFGDIPQEAIRIAKQAILDCVGVALAGAAEPVGKKITRFVAELGGKPQSTVLASSVKVPGPLAALANGAMAHALDYDDTSPTMIGHPSAPIVAAILALAESAGSSGRDVLTSYIVGVEVAAKLGAGINPGLCDAGWHSTGVLGCMGAAAGAAKILQLDSKHTAMALAIAGSQAGGFLRSVGSMLKPLQSGQAARNGVIAALMVESGFSAPEDILEGPWGFCTLFQGKGKADTSKITEKLVSPFEVISPGLGFKPYPSCLATHPAIDAALWLRHRYDLKANQIESVDCYVDYYWAEVLRYTQPRTALEAKFSMQGCVAMALLEGSVGLAQLTDEKVTAPEAQTLMKRIKLHVHPNLRTPESTKSRFTVVKVRLEDGSELTHRVDKSKGQPGMSLTQEELIAKYVDCARLVLPQSRIDKSVTAITCLEELDNIGLLMSLLSV